MVDHQQVLLRHAEYKVACCRRDVNDKLWREWREAELILQEPRRISERSDLAKHFNVKDKYQRRFGTRVHNELLDVMFYKKPGKAPNDVGIDVSIYAEPRPVDDMHFGSTRCALLIGLQQFSEAQTATKEELIMVSRQFTREDLDSTRDISYSGWTEMHPLVRQNLVMKTRSIRPSVCSVFGKYYKRTGECYEFWLTDLGRYWATKLLPPTPQTPPRPPNAPAGEAGSGQKRMRPSSVESGSPGNPAKCHCATALTSCVIPVGAHVSLRALASRPEFNGKLGQVLAWDMVKQRYEVEVSAERRLSVQPSKLTQRCTVDILGNDPILHGRSANILHFNDANGCYDVRLEQKLLDGRDVFCLPPADIVLRVSTCVLMPCHGQNNGKMAQIIACDKSAQVYTLRSEKGEFLTLKFGAVVC